MIDTSQAERIEQNWAAVVDEVREAARAAGRDAEAVKIVGVSKYVDADMTAALVDAGCTSLAESRPQALWDKAESASLRGRVDWHLIGHLQRNKLRRTLRYRPLIHSVDSQRLLDAIIRESLNQQIPIDCLLEINISGEEAKTGLDPAQVPWLLQHLTRAGGEENSRVRILGLMAMAGWGTEAQQARAQFAAVRRLRDQIQQQTGHDLPQLSMGMSGDFQAAILEGATMVRIGSRLFEGVRRE